MCRNCFLKQVVEGKIVERINLKGRRGRRRKQLLDDLKGTRGYWKLKEEALDRTSFGRGYGPDVRHCRINEPIYMNGDCVE
jgi:hypothetical protein